VDGLEVDDFVGDIVQCVLYDRSVRWERLTTVPRLNAGARHSKLEFGGHQLS
jgi:hypothetical protein